MPRFRIIALGDSITYGYPFGHRYSWVELLSQKLGEPICNAGSNGDTFRDLKNRIWIDAVDRNPEYVIVSGGANDFYQQSNPTLMKEFFKRIIEILLESNIKPILALQPPLAHKELEKKFREFRKFVKKEAKKNKFPLLNFYDPFLNSKKTKIHSDLLEDGLHPSVAGYQLMAEVAYPVIQKILK